MTVSDVDSISLTRNLDDNLTSTSYLSQTSKNQTYGYDADHRVTQATNPSWTYPVNYTYDFVGNRTNKTWNADQVQQAYGSANNRLVSVTPVTGGIPGAVQTRSFDAMGNTINDGIGRTYGFDSLGRMTSAASSGSSTVFTVGTDGLRRRKVTTGLDATNKLYAYDDQRRLIGVYGADGLGGFTVSEELVYLASEWNIVGTIRGQAVGGSDGVFYPVLTDQIGTPRVVLDPTDGTSRWEWEAKEAFGYQTPNATPGTAAAFNFDARFPGQWFDPETGLYQNGYRDYDPRTGRYVQSDPIGLGGGWNTYAYVGGQVTGAVDVDGLKDVWVAIWTAGSGHVMMTDRTGRIMTNEIPDFPRIQIGSAIWSGRNLSDRYDATMLRDGPPDAVYRIHVSNDAAFDLSAYYSRHKKTWAAFPNESETNCVMAASDALRAGGFPVNEKAFNYGHKTPQALMRDLDNKIKSGNRFIVKFRGMPW
jgi:RHS repeat-associated protein